MVVVGVSVAPYGCDIDGEGVFAAGLDSGSEILGRAVFPAETFSWLATVRTQDTRKSERIRATVIRLIMTISRLKSFVIRINLVAMHRD
jgi:hypothetical protein